LWEDGMDENMKERRGTKWGITKHAEVRCRRCLRKRSRNAKKGVNEGEDAMYQKGGNNARKCDIVGGIYKKRMSEREKFKGKKSLEKK